MIMDCDKDFDTTFNISLAYSESIIYSNSITNDGIKMGIPMHLKIEENETKDKVTISIKVDGSHEHEITKFDLNIIHLPDPTKSPDPTRSPDPTKSPAQKADNPNQINDERAKKKKVLILSLSISCGIIVLCIIIGVITYLIIKNNSTPDVSDEEPNYL